MKNINKERRRFIQKSSLALSSTIFSKWLSANPAVIKNHKNYQFKADVEIEIIARSANIQILKSGPTTRVQKFYANLLKGPKNSLQHLKGNYLGPILNFTQGQKVRIYFKNQLSEASIIHWHGLHVPQASDGHPMYSIPEQQQYIYEFEVLNRAGTSFYHSHSHQLTAEQVYYGLAGLIIVTDEYEKKLELPDGEYDLPLVIQDRQFNQRNQLLYSNHMPVRMTGFLGDNILVNGKPNIEFNVKSRAYRFRALNGSNSRIYKLAWDDGEPLIAIGTDAGLLERPVTKPYIMLAPGERVDLWLDFSGMDLNTERKLISLPFSGAMPPMMEMHQGRKSKMGMHGMMMNSNLAHGEQFSIARFKISVKTSNSPRLPDKLVTFNRFSENMIDNANKPIPMGISMQPMKPQLNKRSFQMYDVTDFETVELGSYKKISIFHDHGQQSERQGRGGMMGKGMMGKGMMFSMAHPIHMHGQQFQILSRKMEGMRKAAYETVKDGFIDSGWKDTVLVMPGEEIEVIKPFQDYKGLFLYHCHNLEHEDLGMMRQFKIV